MGKRYEEVFHNIAYTDGKKTHEKLLNIFSR